MNVNDVSMNIQLEGQGRLGPKYVQHVIFYCLANDSVPNTLQLEDKFLK